MVSRYKKIMILSALLAASHSVQATGPTQAIVGKYMKGLTAYIVGVTSYWYLGHKSKASPDEGLNFALSYLPAAIVAIVMPYYRV